MKRTQKSRRRFDGGAAKKQAEDRKNFGRGGRTITLPDGMEMFKIEKEGTVRIHIIPYEVKVKDHPHVNKGDLWYERTYKVHFGVGPDNSSFVCPTTVGAKCPVCEEFERMQRDPDADEDVAKALKPKMRQLFNVIDVKSGDTIKLFDYSYHLFGKQLEKEIREGDGNEHMFADMAEGSMLKVRFSKESGGGNSWLEANRIDFMSREALDDSLIDEAVDLDNALVIPTYEELEAAFHGGMPAKDDEDDEDDEEDDEDKPKKKTSKTKRPVEEDDEEDDAADSDDEEDDEDSDDEEDDDEDDEDSDDDEEKCVACEGSGKTSKGKTCPICGGNGTKPPAEEDDEDTDDEDSDDEDSDDEDTDDEDTDDEDDEEEPEPPRARKRSRR